MRRRQNRAASERHISPGQTDSGGEGECKEGEEEQEKCQGDWREDRGTESFLQKMAESFLFTW